MQMELHFVLPLGMGGGGEVLDVPRRVYGGVHPYISVSYSVTNKRGLYTKNRGLYIQLWWRFLCRVVKPDGVVLFN